MKARIAGTSLRALAKAYLATCNVDNLKEDNIDRISSLSNEEFRFMYRRVLQVLDDLPPQVQEKYRLNGRLTRDEFLDSISKLDKRQMIAIVDSVPDGVIAAQLKSYLARRRREAASGDIASNVKMFWKRIVYIIEGQY